MDLKKELEQKIEKSRYKLLEAEEEYGGVYINRLQEEDGVHIRVETGPGSVALSILVNEDQLSGGQTVEDVYSEILDQLSIEGISIYKDETSWEDALFTGKN